MQKFVQCTEKVTDRTCQKWFAKFRAGVFSLDDAPRWGGPGEVDSDQTENAQHYTTQETVNIPKISKSVQLLVKMRNMSFILRQKPHRLFAILTSNCHKGLLGPLPRGVTWGQDEEQP